MDIVTQLSKLPNGSIFSVVAPHRRKPQRFVKLRGFGGPYAIDLEANSWRFTKEMEGYRQLKVLFSPKNT